MANKNENATKQEFLSALSNAREETKSKLKSKKKRISKMDYKSDSIVPKEAFKTPINEFACGWDLAKETSSSEQIEQALEDTIKGSDESFIIDVKLESPPKGAVYSKDPVQKNPASEHSDTSGEMHWFNDYGWVNHLYGGTDPIAEAQDKTTKKDESKKSKNLEIIGKIIQPNKEDNTVRILQLNNGYNFNIFRNDEFSCGVRTIGGIENYANSYGIRATEQFLDFIVKYINHEDVRIQGESQTKFVIFSIRNRHQQLVDLFFKVAETATDFERNPNSGNYIAIFTLSVKTY